MINDENDVQKQTSNAGNDIPTFTAPMPTFTPPPVQRPSGNICYYHPESAAVAKCAKCGKFICKTCFDTCKLDGGEYKGKAMCLDCSEEEIKINIATLKKQRGQIIAAYVFAVIGMIIGLMIGLNITEGASFEYPIIVIIIATLVGGCLWTFIVNMFNMTVAAFKLLFDGEILASIFGWIIGFFKAIFIAVVGTLQKLFYYTKYIIQTSGFIKTDTEGLVALRDYIEYTMIRNQNVGVDIETLINENSGLNNNSYVQSIMQNGEANAQNSFANMVTTFNEHGEIIRSFAG